MTDFEKFLISGELGIIRGGSSSERIIGYMGEPEFSEPERKSYPMMLVYGDLEFRLRKDRLETTVLSLEKDVPEFPGNFVFENLPPLAGRNILQIRKILVRHGVGWRTDQIMTDDCQLVWITARNVHLAFFEGRLTRLGAQYHL